MMPPTIATAIAHMPMSVQLRPWLTFTGVIGRRGPLPPPLLPEGGREPAAGREPPDFAALEDFAASEDFAESEDFAALPVLAAGLPRDGLVEPDLASVAPASAALSAFD